MGSFIHAYTDGGGIRECKVPDDFSGVGNLAFVSEFPGFKKCLLASLVTSSTAVRASNIVTVTATAHGITTGTTYVGYRFFYPGSAGLAAGWYDSITDVQTNTISFNAPGADFGSQSVNGAAAYTTLTALCSTVIPKNTLKANGRLTSNIFRVGDTTAATKNIRNVLAGNQLGLSTATTSPHGTHRLSVVVDDSGKAFSVASSDGGLSGTLATASIDFTADQTFSLSGSVSAAGGFLALINVSLEIVQ